MVTPTFIVEPFFDADIKNKNHTDNVYYSKLSIKGLQNHILIDNA